MGWLVRMLARLGTLLIVLLTFSVGVYLFTSGFLLTRHELNFKSSCQPADNHAADISVPRNTCWTVPSVSRVYGKVVLIVIDALRFDFASYQPRAADNIPYVNKLKVFKDLATEYGCKSSRLFRFRADAPTTTMQRIKGLTTGSFPTFIDVSNNFDSAEIAEDNFIDQLLTNRDQNITFLGDDTWMKLFPGRFQTAFHFPSFDVKDLHLVDDGIMEHLIPELKKQNWKLLIAHFLGVDHCGHRYGPLHSEMSTKLLQMDSMLRAVVDNLDNDTLLLVMGDHGMTQTGDHGGETPEEIDAALFAFSRTGKFSHSRTIDNDNCEAGLIHQIDLVPTLSLLLGTPIPFSNLGSVMIDLIPQREDEGESETNLKDCLRINMKQIETYLLEYNKRYDNLKSEKILRLIGSFANIEKYNSDEMLSLLHEARELCKAVWAQFNENLIVLGLSFFTIIIVLVLYHKVSYKISLFLCSSCVLTLLFSFVLNSILQEYLLLFLLFILFLNMLHLLSKSETKFIGAIAMFYPLLYGSNSFVLSEDAMSLYLYVTALVWLAMHMFTQIYIPVVQNTSKSTRKSHKSAWKFKATVFSLFTTPHCLLVLFMTTFAVALRFLFHFRICRPEQFWCFHAPNGHLVNRSASNTDTGLYYIDDVIDFTNTWTRLFVSGGSLSAVLFAMGFYMKREGNLRKPYSAALVCGTKLLPIAGLCIVLNWQLHTYSAKELNLLPNSFLVILPRCAFLLVLISLLFWFISPLTIHVMYLDRHGCYRDDLLLSGQQAMSYYYQQLKAQIDSGNSPNSTAEDRQRPEPDIPPPAVFGLYTLLSSAVVGFGEVFVVLLAMLLEEKYALVLLAFVLCTGFLVEVVSALNRRPSSSDKVSWDVVGLWMLSSSFWWFLTGHQASLSSIPWNAAFVGFRGNHPSIALPAVMVGANMFASQILHTVFLPLLLCAVTKGKWLKKASDIKKNPFGKLKSGETAGGRSESNEKHVSELYFFQSDMFWELLYDLFFKHIFLHGLKALSCMCFAYLHRRHLMVWQIFAPRVIYEVLSFFVVCGTTVVMCLFLLRFRFALDNWIKTNNFNLTPKNK